MSLPTPEMLACSDAITQMLDQLEALPARKRLPDSAVEHVLSMACNLMRQGKTEKAWGYFRVLTMYRPSDPRILAGFAVCCQELGRLEEAIQYYATAAHVKPGKPEYLLAIAECELLQKDYAQARQSLNIVIRFCQDHDVAGKTRLRAESMLSLIDKGERSASD